MRSFRLLAVAVLVVLMASAAMPASAYINLLQNPGFETGSLAPWGIDGDEYDWGGGVGSPGHTGDYYAWLEVEDDEAWVFQEIGPPRCAQSLEFWYRGGWGEVGELGVAIYYSDGTSHWQDDLSQTDEWSFAHIDLDTAKLVDEVEAYVGADDGEINVDDFDLEACTTAVGGVVIPVSTFAILAPWLAVIGLVGCIGTVVVVAKKRR
jgi:hypothetical protein